MRTDNELRYVGVARRRWGLSGGLLLLGLVLIVNLVLQLMRH